MVPDFDSGGVILVGSNPTSLAKKEKQMRYAISDIHGCIRTFKKALREINFSKDDTLILLGDYIDRGLDSKGLVDYIIELQKDHNVIAIKGNHEEFLLLSQDNYGVYRSWMSNGGMQTLNSYGYPLHSYCVDSLRPWQSYIPKDHLDWFQSLSIVYETEDYVFVHAGLDFQYDDPINETLDDTKLWGRIYRIPGNKRTDAIGGRILVTGHTPTDKDTMIEMANGEDLITIDRGCIFNSSELGHLAVFNLDTKQFRFIKNIDNIERDLM
jgi:serine/threonine protein phosphatase 1